ncbi:MAG: DUF819 family protein [Bacteroidota bacterium]
MLTKHRFLALINNFNSTLMIAPDNAFALFTILAFAAAFGMIGERKNWFLGISGVLVTISITVLLVTFDLMPSAADANLSVPTYDFVFTYIIPISIPLLLFNVQIKRIVKDAGRLLGIFLIGSISIAIGAILAAQFIDLGAETHKIAGAFVGTYIGGSVNFMAVSETFEFTQSPMFPATMAVDVGFTNVYLFLLFLLPSIQKVLSYFVPYEEATLTSNRKIATTKDESSLMEQLAKCFTISGLLCTVGFWLGPILANWLGTDIHLEVLVITILITVLANVFPQFFLPLADTAFDIGMFLMFIFLAVIGAASDINAIINAAPGILAFAIIMLLIHLIISLIGGKLLGISLKEIMVASAANVGGVSIAAPMAATFGMKKSVTPAILIGILGYVVGTFLGIGTGLFLR